MLDVHGKYSMSGFTPAGYMLLGMGFIMLAYMLSEASMLMG